MREISPHELSDWLADAGRVTPFLLDVREPAEVAVCRLEGSTNIPMHLIPSRQAELPDDRPIVVICHHGVRSHHVAVWLEHAGFDTPLSLIGGLAAWADEIDPDMPRY